MMDLATLMQLRFPGARTPQDYQVGDDGTGQRITEWNMNEPEPSQETIVVWKMERAAEYTKQQVNPDIYAQLDKIDLQSIRALRTNDTVKLAELEARAVKLRGKLL